MGIFNHFLGKENKEEQKTAAHDEKKPLQNFRLNVLRKEAKENQTQTAENTQAIGPVM